MLLIILSVCLLIFAAAILVLVATGKGASKRVISRLEALDQEVLASAYVDAPADIRKAQETLSAIPWLNHWLAKLNLSSMSALYLYQAGVRLKLGTLLTMAVAGSALVA